MRELRGGGGTLIGCLQVPMMWLSALLLAETLSGTPAVAVQSSTPQACFIFGEVFWSTTQISAMLSSNCAIRIERKERRKSCTGRQVVGLLWMLSLLILGWPVGIAWADDTRLKPSTGVSQPTPQASHSVAPKQAAVAPAEAGANPLQSATVAP